MAKYNQTGRKRGPYKKTVKQELNQREIKFVTAFLKTGSQKEAAKITGYKDANRVYNRSHIQREIKARQSAAKSRNAIDVDQIIRNLASRANYDPINIFDSDGSLLAVHLMPEKIRVCIKSIKITTNSRGDVHQQIVFTDPQRPAELILRMTGKLREDLISPDKQIVTLDGKLPEHYEN